MASLSPDLPEWGDTLGGTDIRTVSEEALQLQMKEWGYPAFRARQVQDWLHRGVTDFEEMGNLPKTLREQLAEVYALPHVKIRRRLVSKLDGTVKYLYELADGETIESVLMNYHHGWSQCLSTQAGCRMNCAFCATGMGGLHRNLTAGEMLSQIETAQKDRGIRVSSVVLMGMGEPLDNFEEVTRFLQWLSEEGGVHIGMRHISLSTCGLVDKIYDLMEYRWPLTLSISLHAPNNEIRSKIMPINKRWPVEELLNACRTYIDTVGRRISFEYAMMDGINDSDDCARELASKLKGMLCHVNLIPANAVEGKDHRRSSANRLMAFQSIIEKSGIPVTVRRTLGADINASCGQLRREEEQ